MRVIMFKPRFAGLVETWRKRQTVRPTPKREVKFGMELSLREWEGRPYHSKHRVLKDMVHCAAVWGIQLDPLSGRLDLNGVFLSDEEKDSFARKDGFSDFDDMIDWFAKEHGVGVFTGIVIHW